MTLQKKRRCTYIQRSTGGDTATARATSSPGLFPQKMGGKKALGTRLQRGPITVDPIAPVPIQH